MSSLDPNDGLTDAEILGGGKKYSGAGLPMGFVQGSDGIIYKQVDGKLVVASAEEARAAAAAERAYAAGGGAVAPSNKQISTDERTGEALVVDPRTGTITRTGQQIGFAGIDPRETAAAKEQAAAADRQLTARGQAIDLLKQSQNTLLRANEAAEAAKVDRAKLKSSEAIANAQLKEQARQADLRAAVDQYQTALNLIPALGQLSLDESKRVQDVLSNGNDFLARAFESRGGTSPLAKVMQADQINALGSAIGQLRGMINDAIAQSPMAKGGGFQPVDYTNIDPYQAADLTKASATGLPGGSPGVAPLNDPGQYQYSPAPVIAPPPTPAAAGDGAAGGFAGDVPAAAPAPAPAPAYTATSVAALPGMGGGVDPGDTGGIRTDIPAAQQVGGSAYYPAPQGGLAGAIGSVIGAVNSTGASDRGMDNQIPVVPLPAGGYAEADRLAAEEAARAAQGMAAGGFTRAAQMVVGDSVSGRPTGHEEIVVNPTGAPLQVIPNEQAQGFMRAAMPRYGLGTDVMSWLSKVGKKLTDQYNPGDVHQAVLDYAYQQAVSDEMKRHMNGGNDPGPVQYTGDNYMGMLPGESDSYRAGREDVARANERRRVTGITDPSNSGEGGRGAGVEYMGTPTFYPRTGGGVPYERISGIIEDLKRGFMGAMPRYATGTGLIDSINAGLGSGAFNASTVTSPATASPYAGLTPSIPKGAMYHGVPVSQTSTGYNSRGQYYITGEGPVYADQLDSATGWRPPASAGGFNAVTQADLVKMAHDNAPPAALAVMNGQPVPARQSLASTVDPTRFLRPMTSRQLNSLDPAELKALGTMTNVEFNAPLDYVTNQTARQYGPSQQRRSGFAGAMGI